MIVGVTGSRHRRPQRTMQALRSKLKEWGAIELHHGDCVGFDEQAHAVAVSLGIKTVSHPPDNPSLRAYCEADKVMPAAPYLERNKMIVAHCDRLIAAPDGPETVRSGTWSTVRYAKKIGRKGVVLGFAELENTSQKDDK